MLIANAFAQDAANAAGGNSMIGMVFNYLPILMVFAILYFMVIRPQNQSAKEHGNLVSSLKKGDMVLTEGGLVAEVVQVGDSMVRVASAGGEAVIGKFAVKKRLDDDDIQQWRKLGGKVPAKH